MRLAHLTAVSVLLAGCADSAPPTVSPAPARKASPARAVTLYLPGMNKDLKIL